ncbi:hypothetical protein A2V82_08460 [candidate division KSB1 bacterium RBG_16_48_16]|nr:MAG: hypothetical protein A2V82_08460 [candidate division KSB1 bacterium RBG_16_48_16]
MKNCATIILIVTFFAGTSFGQTDWFWQYPQPQGNTLNDVFMIDENTAVAVGELGTIVRTTDGGEHWQVIYHQVGTSENLNAVFFINNHTGWAVGERGVTIKTTDGGQSWQALDSPTEYHLYDVCFVDENRGFIVGRFGKILRTTDGGASWITLKSGTQRSLQAIEFIDNKTGITVGSGGTIIKTRDGGETWQVVQAGYAYHLKAVQFVDHELGYAVGTGGTVLKTRDGGASWSRIDNDMTDDFYTVQFANADTGWAVGYAVDDNEQAVAALYSTEDGGLTWHYEQALGRPLNAIHLNNQGNGWAVGGSGTIARVKSYGGEIIAQSSEELYWLYSVYFFNPDTGFAAGIGGVMRTNDGGTTWTQARTDTNGVIGFLDISFANQDTGVMVGGQWLLDGQTWTPIALISHTTDGGQTWHDTTFTSHPYFWNVHLTPSGRGWAVGVGGALMQTEDMGVTWSEQSLDASLDWNGLFFINDTTGWIVGGYGSRGYKTTDGGETWERMRMGGSYYLMDVFFLDERTGWAVGYNGAVLVTRDGGEHWEEQESGATAMLYSIFLTETTTGYAVGEGGTIVRTIDGGQTWENMVSPTSKELDVVFFINTQTGWIAGEDGTILKTVSGFTDVPRRTQEPTTLPLSFSLGQNYPNPFNPVTTIPFTLDKPTKVTLKIFDLLGKEVATLVDARLAVGHHTANFNGANLASGVYFYRLTGDSRSEIRKLVLQK